MDTQQTGAVATLTPQFYNWVVGRLVAGGWTRGVADNYLDEKLKKAVTVRNYDRAVKVACAAYGQLHKGIIASGEYGCGKTHFISALTGFDRIPYKFDMNDRISREFLDPNGGYRDEYNNLFKHSIFIDDLGAELRKNYGENDYSEAKDFICEYHTRGQGRLFVTTNLTGEEIVNAYGGRFFDRLKDLCVPLKFLGGSKRKWEVVK